jgi:small subunit ribosomal protein S6e
MVEFKLNLNDPKTGLSYKKEVKDQNAKAFLGKMIGESIKGEAIDMQGYEFEITGGSDNCGFPMRSGILTPRKKLYAFEGVGLKRKARGIMQRKTVCGMVINDKITQINLKITKQGKEALVATPSEKKDKEKK